MNTEEIKSIIAENITYWQKKADDSEEGYKHHGAVCELMHLSGKPELITPEYLREQWKEKKKRANTSEFENRTFDLMARNRAVKACDAIAALGRQIVELDKKSKRQ